MSSPGTLMTAAARMRHVILAPAFERFIQVSYKSKVSGACTPMVGCSAEAGCHAR